MGARVRPGANASAGDSVNAAESANALDAAAANSEPTPADDSSDGPSTARSRTAGPRTLDLVLAIVVVALSIGSVLLVLVPSLELVVVSHDLDIVVNTVATAAAAAVAALAWIRFKEGGQPIMLFQAAAFTVLAASNASLEKGRASANACTAGAVPGAR